VAASREHGLHRIECPVPESAETIPLIKELRHLANSAGVRLAGLETQTSAEAFRPYLRAGAYDVMMPDVKYAGGPAEMLRIAELFAHHKVAFSPHNPTGPICHAHSLQVCAAVRNSDLLEHQFDESPAFDAIIGHAISAPRDGFATLDWTKPGLGVALETEPEQSKTVSFLAGEFHS
ncbi:MAG: enolase C-terminal domain-like protein, partial [Haliea sp.]